MDHIIKERRLRWLVHVLRMEDDRITKASHMMANGLMHQKKTWKTEIELD